MTHISQRIRIAICIVLVLVVGTIQGCASCERSVKSMQSNIAGLERTVILYDYNGGVIDSWHGQIDIDESDQEILFDLDGKRTIIQRGIVVVQEETQSEYDAWLETIQSD